MIGAHSYSGILFIRRSFDRFELFFFLHKRIIHATTLFEIRSDPVVRTFLLVHVTKRICPFQSHIWGTLIFNLFLPFPDKKFPPGTLVLCCLSHGLILREHVLLQPAPGLLTQSMAFYIIDYASCQISVSKYFWLCAFDFSTSIIFVRALLRDT